MSLLNYELLSWQEVQKNLESKILFLPIGSLEQHGPHLPLSVDSLLVSKICEEIAGEVDGIVAPPILYGARSLPNSGGGLSYPGTIYLSGELLIDYYYQILKSYINSGAKKIFVLNGHWENEPFIIEGAEKLNSTESNNNTKIIILSWWSVISDAEMEKIFGEFHGWHVEHAGQAETALMYFYYSNYVNMSLAVNNSTYIPTGIYQHPVPISWKGNMGVLSNCKHITSEMGEKLALLIKQKLTELILNW